jgi:hypothetical protein
VSDGSRGARPLDEDQEHPAGARRALAWLLAGLVAGAGLVVLLAPELLADLRVLGQVLLLAAVAGVPGLVLLVIVAARRRR